MKILVSAYSCEPHHGSEPGAGFSLVTAAAAIGDVWVMTRANNVKEIESALAESPPEHPVRVVPVDGPPWALRIKKLPGMMRFYYAMWQRLAERKAEDLNSAVGGFDVVHHATMSAFWMPMGVVNTGLPVVVGPVSGGTFTPRTMWRYLGRKGLARDGLRWLLARTLAPVVRRRWRGVDVVIAQNQQMHDFVSRHLIPPDASLLKQSHAVEPTLRHLPPVESRSREILFVGRLLTWKGILLAVDTFERARVDNARLVFVGTGPDEAPLRRHIVERGLCDTVEIAGSLDRDVVLQRMRRASCLLFPSFHDSAGFVVSEALSVGLPVVCLDHGGPGELVRSWPRVESVAVPVGPADRVVEELAAAVRRYVDEPAPIPGDVVETARPLKDAIGEAYAIAASGVGTS